MRVFLVPIAIYLALVASHLSLSNSPVRVHVVSSAILALAYLVPALISAHSQSWLRRLSICAIFAIAGMFLWDACAYMIIAKAEPFFVLRGTPVLYLIGLMALVCLSFVAAWLASPLNAQHKRPASAA